jgi:phosphatidylserine/phosphatidylglycerophosphate/cardiolipin synthase-like enzyme
MPGIRRIRPIRRLLFALFALSLPTTHAFAAEQLCDTSFQDCRKPLLALIQAERVGIDASFQLMEDPTIASALIARLKAGIPVRLIVEPRRSDENPLNGTMLAQLAAGHVPMRSKAGALLHWKVMIFAGQNTVEFAAANYSDYYFVPVVPYRNYTDEAIYFCDDPQVVNSFKTKFDTAWIDTVGFGNYANITAPLVRRYPVYPMDPDLNFVPAQDFIKRSVPLYDAEKTQIDVSMYKATDVRLPDAMSRAARRGVIVRFLVEPSWYRDKANVWQAYNIDRMWAAGVKVRQRLHAGFLHQKTTLLYGSGLSIFGSSNWTEGSANQQYEHNYFTNKVWMFQWFRDEFARKWNSSVETTAFVPQPPEAPVIVSPANLAVVASTTTALVWKGGSWAWKADVYFGTSSTPPLYTSVSLSPGATKTLTLPTLKPATTYYWKVVDKTMAAKSAASTVRSFRTP